MEQILQVLEYEKALGLPARLPPSKSPMMAFQPLHSPGDERVHEADGSAFVYVPGGEYALGADGISLIEGPVHRVVLSPFWIAKHPVTNEQYDRFLIAVPGTTRPEFWRVDGFNQPQQPVVGVNWDEAQTYCRWAGLALPSEAQWEAAARGKDRRRYPWGNDAPTLEHANFGENRGQPTAVGIFPRGAGPFGTLDQAGNVWEWCVDVWDQMPYWASEGARDPVNNRGNPFFRCLRGGSWNVDARLLTATFRSGAQVFHRDRYIGFRCVLPAPDEP